MPANLRFWGAASAVLLAYGAWTVAAVLGAWASETQQARVLTCSTRPGTTPEDLVKGSMAMIVGSLFAAGVRQRYSQASGAS